MRKVQYEQELEQELGRALRDLDYAECPPNGMGVGTGVVEVTPPVKDDGFMVIQGFAFSKEEQKALDLLSDLPLDSENQPAFDALALLGAGMTTAMTERKLIAVVRKQRSDNHIYTFTSHGVNILNRYRRATCGIV